MTWSIIARDEARPGGSVSPCRPSFSRSVRSCRTSRPAGVGAVATQAFVNPHYGPAGLDLIATGMAAGDVIAKLTRADEGRDHRQLHVMDKVGRFAQHTGKACIDWCGHVSPARDDLGRG